MSEKTPDDNNNNDNNNPALRQVASTWNFLPITFLIVCTYILYINNSLRRSVINSSPPPTIEFITMKLIDLYKYIFI